MRQISARVMCPAVLAAGPVLAQGAPKGFDLAVTVARKAVTAPRTDIDTANKLPPSYAHHLQSLIDVSGVVNGSFAKTAANDHWRE